jgi:vanillate O-demethylase monooxygenase subunit
VKYLFNAWYVAASSAEVQAKPVGRTILEKRMAIYRTESGEVAAFQDRCPHRFVPLSRGHVRGDNLECAYHGLQFDRSGNCVLNPHGDHKIPKDAGVRHFPVIERYGFIWVWPGDAAEADPAGFQVPMYDFLEAPEKFVAVRGYLNVQANYQLIHDNLLDLSHVEFLHAALARKEGVSSHNTEVLQEGDKIQVNRWKPNSSLNQFAKLFWNSDSERGDGRANITWLPPTMLYIDLGVTEVGAPIEDGVCTPAAHLITPETEFTSHYFWAQARNRRLEDEELSHRVWSAADSIFRTEDEPIIESQQDAMGRETDVLSLKPVLFEPDIPSVRARRVLTRLIADEQSG